ncbi:MAG: sulfur carrier protein ThiS [Pseudomonadota bacterium]
MTERSAPPGAIPIQLNGEPREAPAGLTLSGLITWLELDPRKVAVERNLEIAPRSAYHEVRIEAGDRLEIVQFVGGG